MMLTLSLTAIGSIDLCQLIAPVDVQRSGESLSSSSFVDLRGQDTGCNAPVSDLHAAQRAAKARSVNIW
jgi:hypothetical protein